MAAKKSGPPQLPGGVLGFQPKFRTFGLHIVSHATPNFKMTEQDGNVLKIKMGYKDPVRTTADLIDASTNKEYEHVFVQTDSEERNIEYNIIFPRPGFYKVQIFALPASDPGKSLANVFNYLIECVKVTTKPFTFPTKYQDWTDDCYLYEPMTIHRAVTGDIVPFKLKGPKGARRVAVVVDQQWTNLTISADGTYWVGNVFLGLHYGTFASVTVNSTFQEEQGSYDTLLKYADI